MRYMYDYFRVKALLERYVLTHENAIDGCYTDDVCDDKWTEILQESRDMLEVANDRFPKLGDEVWKKK